MGDITIFGQNSLNLNFEHCERRKVMVYVKPGE